MRYIAKYLIMTSFLAVAMAGCYYDEVVVFKKLPVNVSLKNDLMPIFNQSCNTGGCHDLEGSNSPSLVADRAYESLVYGSMINTLEPEKSILYQQIVTGAMPPSGPLTSNEQKIILAWITEGARNN